MSRTHRKEAGHEESQWIGYTDLLSSSLLILLLTVAVTAIAKATIEKPPLIRLTEEQAFRFKSGSYTLDAAFINSLDRQLPAIRETITKYGVDTVEVIGHTDGQPSPGLSNLDIVLPKAGQQNVISVYKAGSNTDLGLLRAMAVASYLKTRLDQAGDIGLIIRPYSAGSLIASDGQYSPADTRDRPDRRRIEIRFTRRSES
jgi:outer membrane protein OmpA-like peptidoglycan-associated protein